MDYFDSGFCVRTPSWHMKEDLLDEHPESWGEAREKAGLQWEPISRPSFITRYLSEFDLKLCASQACIARVGKPHAEECDLSGNVEMADTLPRGTVLGQDGVHAFVPDPAHQQVLRSDSFALLETGLTTNFRLIYHGRGQGPQGDSASMEEIIDTFVGKGVKFDTAGSAKGGALIWAVMFLDEPFSITGDTNGLTLPYITLLNGHTGEAACKLGKTKVRVVCANTWAAGNYEMEASGQQLVFRHTANVEDRITQAAEAISDVREEVKQFVAMAEVMQQVHLSDKLIAKYTSEFLPNPAENGEQVSDKVQKNVEEARSVFTHFLVASPTCEGIEDTMYGVMQASIEYLDHARRYRSKESYMGRTILHGEPLKHRALGIAGDVFRSELSKVSDPWADQLIDLGKRERERSMNARPLTLKR